MLMCMWKSSDRRLLCVCPCWLAPLIQLVADTQQVADVKKALAVNMYCKPEQLHLEFGSETLADCASLEHYKIRDGSQVDFALATANCSVAHRSSINIPESVVR